MQLFATTKVFVASQLPDGDRPIPNRLRVPNPIFMLIRGKLSLNRMFVFN